MKLIKVDNVEHLKKLCQNEGKEFRLSLGGISSSKHILYELKESTFYITNYIDGTEQKLTDIGLWKKSNIGRAIETGNFFMEDFEND